VLCASLSACGLLRSKPDPQTGELMPKTVAVVPVANQSQDITLPALIRFFLEEELDDKGFSVILRFDEIDDQLRQLGVTDGSQIHDGNIQNIGQSLKVEGLLQCILHEATQSKGVRVIRATFRLISVFSGRTLWEKQYEVEQKVAGRIPVKGTVTPNWTLKQARSLARSSAGKLPKKLVQDALKSLHR